MGGSTRLTTGIAGLDTVLGGGLFPASCTLLSGLPGTGKTTVGLHFLCAGAQQGEPGVLFTFEQFPQQIYRDASNLGWDLPALERAGKLQIVCAAPEVFLNEAESVDGLLDELVKEIGLRRAVVDSINLLTVSEDPDTLRRTFYRVRNAMTRLQIAAMFTHELSERSHRGHPYEYVSDSVLRLAYDAMDVHRVRCVEVLKHRGSAFMAGRHLLTIGTGGIRVLPAHGFSRDLPADDGIPTGLPALDHALGHGLPRGTVCVLDVSPSANTRLFLTGLAAAHARVGFGLFLTTSAQSTLQETVELLRLHGVDPAWLGRQGRFLAAEVAGRPVPPEVEPFVHRVPVAPDPAAGPYPKFRNMMAGPPSPHPWLLITDVNNILLRYGLGSTLQLWSTVAGTVKNRGHSMISLCNFDEVGASVASRFQRTATAILKVWTDGNFQYLAVEKTASGRTSRPMAMEFTDAPPFISLW